MSDQSTTAVPNQVGTNAWESEGGALKPKPATDLPEGIIAVTSNEYRVGQYRYTNLDDAMAEQRRQAAK
ncbi:hypothetical protein P7228_04280 [Altererythrobacter arenosus]|uniref:Uncharacterized protein n=1 Tax=Altererythrobacter arenosus TaxID=3032592 RepID=A0ABY8G1D1_9SPHN|nr:hypothetical protein [Altererythrobacter sp. CAU 1644]WFL78289.1 hypothetical protein P7228_04280 [Altererythrobacter sp. CAU 1644]